MIAKFCPAEIKYNNCLALILTTTCGSTEI